MLPGDPIPIREMEFRPMIGKAVMCQTGGCDRPAAWLLASRDGKSVWAAQCDLHARDFAVQNGVAFSAEPRDAGYCAK